VLIWLYGEDGYIAPHHPHGSGRPPVPFELDDKKKEPPPPEGGGGSSPFVPVLDFRHNPHREEGPLETLLVGVVSFSLQHLYELKR